MSINDTHDAIGRLAGFVGWNSDTLLLLIARWAEENGAARPLLEHLSALASAEDEQPLDDDTGGCADRTIPAPQARPSRRDFHFQEVQMPDYFTQFSCVLDVRTPANAKRALDIFATACLDGDPDTLVSNGCMVEIDDAEGGSQLWIYADDFGNPECVITFALRCAEAFDLSGRWGFKYANTCSKPNLDAYGGGAHVIDLGARRTIGWVSTNDWLVFVLDGGDPDASPNGPNDQAGGPT